MTRANVVGVSQAGCASFFSAIRMARGLFAAEPNLNLALCVAAERLPPAENREILYSLISDGGCAALVERNATLNRIVAYAQVTKGFYWDSAEKQDEIVAAYFPTARAVIREALEYAGLTLDDIRLIIPHNVNLQSWRVLLSLLEVPKEKFFGRNIGSRGHTIAADNIMNLADAVRLGRVRSGDFVMLFTFGFGAHWACMILQH
jgi:3-oxoacyl-[acyl-carrier-protein] synthase-3